MSNSAPIILPPPNLRHVLHATADFIALKGPAIERKIRENKLDNPAFSFLKESDPYYAYFRDRIRQQKENAKPPNGGDPPKKSALPSGAAKEVGASERSADADAGVQKNVENVSFLKAYRAKAEYSRVTPTEALDADLFSIPALAPPPSPLAFDVIKLAAEHAAIYGDSFVATLAQKEMRNALFDFLNPLHVHHIIYQRLTEAYKCLIGSDRSAGVQDMLKRYEDSWHNVLKDVWRQYDWDCGQAERELKDEDQDIAGSGVDWYDFVVLDTVVLDENDTNLPAPVTDTRQIPNLLATAQKAEMERNRNLKQVDMEIDEAPPTDANVSMDIDAAPSIPANLIRKHPVAQEKRASEISVMLPSGQKVPLSQAEASMRVELINPAYKDERIRAVNKNRLQNLAGGEEIAQNLARLEARRTEGGVYNRADLQGELSKLPKVSAEEVDRRMKKAVASGPQLPGTTAKQHRDKVEAAVDALSKAKQEPARPPPEEAKVVEKTLPGLVSAEEWVKKNGASAPVKIGFPKHSNTEWDLRGQTVEMKARLKRSVRKLKSVICKLTKVPANKQKLFIEGRGFLKDDMSLAYYNVGDGGVIGLEIKERGGRKRH